MSSPKASSSAHTLDHPEFPDPEDEGEYVDHLLILYASETGNSQDVAERMGREVRRRGARCVLMSMDVFDVVSDANAASTRAETRVVGKYNHVRENMQSSFCI